MMAEKVKVELLRPLNGLSIGSVTEYDEADVKRLEARGAVRRVKQAKAPENKAAPAHDNKGKAEK